MECADLTQLFYIYMHVYCSDLSNNMLTGKVSVLSGHLPEVLASMCVTCLMVFARHHAHAHTLQQSKRQRPLGNRP